jgi:hypothetical protein
VRGDEASVADLCDRRGQATSARCSGRAGGIIDAIGRFVGVCGDDAEDLASLRSASVPQSSRPGADLDVEQVLAALVLERDFGGGDLDKTGGRRVRQEVDWDIGAHEASDAPDELVACRDA